MAKQQNNARGGKGNHRSDKRDWPKGNPYGNKKQGTQKRVDGDPFPDQDQLPTSGERDAAEAMNDINRFSKSNPVSFYTKFDKFVLDAARLPFANPLGVANLIIDEVAGEPRQDDFYVPGIMAIRFIPSIGVSKDFTSPMNRSSIRFYTYLRSNQKASASYDHQDVSMMMVSMDSAYMFHALLSKIYSVVNQFTPANEYYSRGLMLAMNADFDDVRMHLQDLRAYINAYAYQLSQYAIPAGITWFDRHRWMCEGLYTDSTSTRAQTYMFVPDGFWVYDNTVTTGSQCTYKKYLRNGASDADVPYTYAQLKAFGDTLINAVSNEEDFAVISGDIYNFYGGDTFKVPYIDENYSVLPIYDETVLSQIENANFVGQVSDASLVITQNPSVNGGAILFQPVTTTQNLGLNQLHMNFHHDSPSSEEVIEASRLMAVAEDIPASESSNIVSCGTELVWGVAIYSRSANLQFVRTTSISNALYYSTATTKESLDLIIKQVMALAQFDWAPHVRVWTSNGTDPTYELIGSTWDIDNYDVVPKQYMQNIHLGCLLSLFTVGTNRE